MKNCKDPRDKTQDNNINRWWIWILLPPFRYLLDNIYVPRYIVHHRRVVNYSLMQMFWNLNVLTTPYFFLFQLLQNLGKADKTTDEIFEEHLLNFNQQQANATRLQKDISNYIRCIKGIIIYWWSYAPFACLFRIICYI